MSPRCMKLRADVDPTYPVWRCTTAGACAGSHRKCLRLLPSVGRFIFSGALVPKQIKRLLKMRGLSAVVARDAESVQTMDEALDVVGACIDVRAF